MIQQVEFRNFRVLRQVTLPLSQFTLIVGPNGSGKSTALLALQAAGAPGNFQHSQLVTVGSQDDVLVTVVGNSSEKQETLTTKWIAAERRQPRQLDQPSELKSVLSASRHFALQPEEIHRSVPLLQQPELKTTGYFLTGVLHDLRDRNPDRLEALKEDLAKWLPEYRNVVFNAPKNGQIAFSLQTMDGQRIPASFLSHGTLFAISLLTIAHLPELPKLVTIEDPDRGIHPRLLSHIRDAMYRLAFPADFKDQRDAVQVIATSHSPYLLDLFREHPEEVVISHKTGNGADFERLSDRPDIDDILGNSSLGEVWYSGILGGVPTAT